MGQRNRKHIRKNGSHLHFLTGILFMLMVSAGSFWWGVLGNFAKEDKNRAMEEVHTGPKQETEEYYDGREGADTLEKWNLILVNHENPIPDNYSVNLVEVEGGERVDERIYEPLMEMLEDARGVNWGALPVVVSGYRTQEKQQSLYDDKIAKYKKDGYSDSEALEMARQWVAQPGYSEHQLGFAVDINGAAYDVYLWLQENSYKYGFIFRYPGNKTDITKVAEEVWHYRYVGVNAAKEMYERGICLEEYLGEES